MIVASGKNWLAIVSSLQNCLIRMVWGEIEYVPDNTNSSWAAFAKRGDNVIFWEMGYFISVEGSVWAKIEIK